MASDDDKKKAQELVEQAGRLLVSLQNEPEHKTQLANKAIGYLDEAITLDPENDKAWNNRGSAKSDIGDHHGAIADYDKAIRLNPDNDFAWSGRGEAKSRLGDHHGAMADCDKAIEINPDNDLAWNSRGLANHALGKYEESIKDLDEALRLNPYNESIQINRLAAEIALKRAETPNAIKQRKEITDALEKSIEEQKNSRWWLRCIQIGLLVTLFYIIGGYFSPVFCFTEFLCFTGITKNIIGQNNASSPLSFLPLFSILGFLIMPIIWGLRITGQAIMHAHILEQDYFSRLNVMNSLEYYQSDFDSSQDLKIKRSDLIMAYMESWMNNNTADRMERLYYKKSDAGKTPHEDMMKQCCEILEKSGKSSTGGKVTPSPPPSDRNRG